MQMLYQSDQYVVVRFDPPAPAVGPQASTAGAGGYEIVDRLARREIYIDGAVADAFREGVEALAQAESEPEAFDSFIAGYAALARQPLVVH